MVYFQNIKGVNSITFWLKSIFGISPKIKGANIFFAFREYSSTIIKLIDTYIYIYISLNEFYSNVIKGYDRFISS